MLTSRISLSFLLASLALVGCSAPAQSFDDVDAPVAESGDALTTITATAASTLASQLAAHTLPSPRLRLASFELAKIGGLVGQPAVTTQKTLANVTLGSAPGVHVTLDRPHGTFLLTTLAPGAAPAEGTEGRLALGTGTIATPAAHPDFDWRAPGAGADPQATTSFGTGYGRTPSLAEDLSLLASFGIPTGEILKSFAAETLALDHQNGVPQTPRIHRAKNFALRGFAGVPVRGNRAIVSHAPDGRITRVLAVWPALAAGGHKLSTKLTSSAILTLANRVLAVEKLTTGRATVSLEYVPTVLSTGECTLKLTGVVKVAGSAGTSEHGDETRSFDFDVTPY